MVANVMDISPVRNSVIQSMFVWKHRSLGCSVVRMQVYRSELSETSRKNRRRKMSWQSQGMKLTPSLSNVWFCILVFSDHGLNPMLLKSEKKEFRLCAIRSHWCGIFHYLGWTASIGNWCCYFSHACYASLGLSFFHRLIVTLTISIYGFTIVLS